MPISVHEKDVHNYPEILKFSYSFYIYSSWKIPNTILKRVKADETVVISVNIF
jgi:hypothetical protein